MMKIAGNKPLVDAILAAVATEDRLEFGCTRSPGGNVRIRELLQEKIDAHCKACVIAGD
jgi:hypothetical protein